MSQDLRQIFHDADALALEAAREIQHAARTAIAERGIFTWALAGGSTPRKLYAILAKETEFADFPWNQTQLFFGDERHVAPDDKESNFRMVSETLLVPGRVPAAHAHRVRAELPEAAQAATEYDAELHTVFGTPALRFNGYARFDLILLGMGPDGHTASLFPGSKALEERDRWFVANWVEKFKSFRLTLTFPVLNAAEKVFFLVAGEDKASMVHEVLVERRNEPFYPVQSVRPTHGVKKWFLDQAAASRLPKPW